MIPIFLEFCGLISIFALCCGVCFVVIMACYEMHRQSKDL